MQKIRVSKKNISMVSICIVIMTILIFFTMKASAADYYIAQSSSGNNDASSCSNAKAYNWNWTSPNVIAGDTIHLCGTFTSTLTIPQSFSAPGVTVKFESGAKFSKAAWGAGSGAAIYVNGKSNITIDGNSVGIIENTDNGTSLGTHQESYGINVNNASNITVKNLTVRTIYKRTPDSDDSNQFGRGIVVTNCNNVLIESVDVSDAYFAMFSYSSTGTKTGLTVQGSSFHKASTGIVVANLNGSTYTNVILDGNTIYDLYVWDGCWSSCTVWSHNDGIHTWGTSGAGGELQITIRNNIIGGDFGSHTTAWIYLSDYTTNVEIYNNILYATSESPANGYITLHSYGVGGAKIYNNTIASHNTLGNGIYITGSASTWTADVKNNIFSDVYVGINNNSNNTIISSDNNNYYNLKSVGMITSTWYSNLAIWRTALGGCPGEGNECNSITTNPMFISSSDFRLQAASPAINAGTQLTSYFSTDKDGNIRSAYWDVGAYEYGLTVGSTPTYALNTSVSGSGAITSNDLAISCGSTCSASYASSTTVTITAEADTGYSFSNWSGACSGSATTCTVTMDATKSVTATFTPNTYALTVTKAATNTGTGTVSSSNNVISCGSDCSESYTYGTVVTLTATADSGSAFYGWSGACTGTATCQVTMDAVKNVSASFLTQDTPALSVGKKGTGKGKIKSTAAVLASSMASTSSIDCGDVCVEQYENATKVTLTAEPETGSTFAGWEGACSGTGDCVVIVSAATSVTATFTSQASSANSTSGVGADGGGGGGCFIATAAFGSYLDSHVIILREFRDKVLLKNDLGKLFVKFYYANSPAIAHTIEQNEVLRVATRLALTPFIYTVVYPYAPAMLLLTALLIAFVIRRKKMHKPADSIANEFVRIK